MTNLGNISRIKVPEDVDEALENLGQVFQQSLATSTTTVTEAKPNKFQYISQDLKYLITAKKKARKVASLTEDSIDKRRANMLGQIVSKELRTIY